MLLGKQPQTSSDMLKPVWNQQMKDNNSNKMQHMTSWPRKVSSLQETQSMLKTSVKGKGGRSSCAQADWSHLPSCESSWWKDLKRPSGPYLTQGRRRRRLPCTSLWGEVSTNCHRRIRRGVCKFSAQHSSTFKCGTRSKNQNWPYRTRGTIESSRESKDTPNCILAWEQGTMHVPLCQDNTGNMMMVLRIDTGNLIMSMDCPHSLSFIASAQLPLHFFVYLLFCPTSYLKQRGVWNPCYCYCWCT